MKVNFANCEVDVWKLRKGVVVGTGRKFYPLAHIVGFHTVLTYVCLLTLDCGDSAGPFEAWDTRSLTWLEPH